MKSPWIALVAALVVIVLTSSLGVWQLRRAAEKAAAQGARDAALADPPLRIGATSPTVGRFDGRRVELIGRFDPAGTLLLDNRTHGGVAGFHVLTALRVEEGGPVVMVLRGWVARDVRDRTRPLAFSTPTEPVRLEGLALAELPQPIVLGHDDGSLAPGTSIIQRFDLEAWRRARAPDAAPFVVRQVSVLDDGLLRDWVQPGSGVDRHYGYAVQWFALSALTAVMGWLAATRARRGRTDGAA
ncbi:MAG: SURF1 family protein [Burkholderiaceae bacterium]